MSADRQAPDPSIVEIAAALDRIGMRRAPGRGHRAMAPTPRPHVEAGAAHGEHEHGGPRGHRGAMGARRMLHAIVHAEQPRSITDLGHAIGVDQPRASRLVQALGDAGLVRRIPDPADGRRTVIEATRAGRARFEAHAEARAAEVAAAATSLTSAERAELARLLAKLALAWPA
ncbi:MarR family winged helix-turn-helix transcriptional regulator [Agrococcus sp. Marseille-P2731]|uniref:MarR family winged helix-turn-helix transcriptional regulator n=1 Tax=Agrococcus sp. Marseille-P2731 TaxID=1841862 RepID=UPI001F352DFE|nr:MarR family winged helix-turn-helix transcriptional regulator [Agrococcus sp. Marseille-P2731]